MRLPPPPPGFVGREAERRRVARLWRRSRLVLLVGVGGIGKTALMQRLVEDLAGDAPVALHRCGTGGTLLDGLDRALGQAVVATSSDDRVFRIAAKLDDEGGVLCVDDVHLLPSDESQALWRLAGLLRQGRVVATSRRSPDLGDLEGAATQVELRPLALDEATTLVGELLDRAGRDADPAALARASAGSPLWCRLLAGGAHRVEEHVDSLMGGLDSTGRAVVEHLSVFRGPVPPSWVRAAKPVVRDLASRFLVERLPGGRIAVHEVVRDLVVATLGNGRRADLHRACAEALANAGEVGERLHHLEASGDHRALALALHEGGAAWLWGYRRVEECIRLVDVVARAGAEVSPRLLLRKALCLLVLGRTAEARECFRSTTSTSRDAALRTLVELRLLHEEGAPPETRVALFEELLTRSERFEPTDWGLLLYGHMWDCLFRGRADDALRAWSASKKARARMDDLSRVRILDLVGAIHGERGERGAADRAFADAERLAASLESPELVGLVARTRCGYAARFGDLAAAERHLVRAESLPGGEAGITEEYRVGRRASLLACAGRLGEAVAALDGLAAATAPSDEARAVMPTAVRSFVLARSAAFASEAGDAVRARRAARALLSIPRRRRPWHDGVEALVTMARVDLQSGRFRRARRIARAALEAATRASLRERAGQAEVVVAECEVLLERDAEAARLGEAAVRAGAAMGARLLEGRALLVLARNDLRAGRPKIARRRAREALRVARAGGHALLQARASIALGWCAIAEGRDARRELAAARRERARCGAAVLDAEVRLLDLARRAAKGSRRAREALEVEEAEWPSLVPLPRGQLVGGAPVTAAAGCDLWMDARTGRVVVDGVREVDLGGRPILARLLRTLLEDPRLPVPKDRLFGLVWRLPYRPLAHDPVLYKALERLRRRLDPDPKRFVVWDEVGSVALRAERPGLHVPESEVGLSARQSHLLDELRSRRTHVTNREYRTEHALSRTTALRDLEDLVERGLVRRERVGRELRYRV